MEPEGSFTNKSCQATFWWLPHCLKPQSCLRSTTSCTISISTLDLLLILRILKASFCLRLGLCYSFCLVCSSPRSPWGLAAHRSGVSSNASSSRRPPPPYQSVSSNFLTLSHVIIYLLFTSSCSKICFMRAKTISILFSAISSEPSPGTGTERILIYLLDKWVLTKTNRKYWLRKKKKGLFQHGDLVYVDSMLKQLVKFNSMEKNSQNDIFAHWWIQLQR